MASRIGIEPPFPWLLIAIYGVPVAVGALAGAYLALIYTTDHTAEF